MRKQSWLWFLVTTGMKPWGLCVSVNCFVLVPTMFDWLIDALDLQAQKDGFVGGELQTFVELVGRHFPWVDRKNSQRLRRAQRTTDGSSKDEGIAIGSDEGLEFKILSFLVLFRTWKLIFRRRRRCETKLRLVLRHLEHCRRGKCCFVLRHNWQQIFKENRVFCILYE